MPAGNRNRSPAHIEIVRWYPWDPATDVTYLHHRSPIALAVGLLATAAGSLHATGALLANGDPSPLLLAAGVSGLVFIFAGVATLPLERARQIALALLALSVVVYVPWLLYAMVTEAKPIPVDPIGATLTGLLAAAVAAMICAGAVLACHRVELLLGWQDPPEKRLLSEREYAAFQEEW